MLYVYVFNIIFNLFYMYFISYSIYSVWIVKEFTDFIMNEFEALLFSVHRLLLMSTIAGMYMCEVTTTRQLLTKVLIFKRNLKKRRSYHYRTHRSNYCLPCILLSVTIEHKTRCQINLTFRSQKPPIFKVVQ